MSAEESADVAATLEWVNDIRHSARVTKFHIARDPSGEVYVEASALLPFAYEREAFGVWMLQWVQETSRINPPASRRGSQRERP